MTTPTPGSLATTARDVLRQVMQRTLQYDFTVWQWGDAIAIDGLLDAADVLDDALPRDRVRSFVTSWAGRPPSWIDHLAPGSAVLRLASFDGDAGLVDRAQGLARWLTHEVPHTADGLPLYRPDLGSVRHSCWVDTLYHEPVFLARVGVLLDDAAYLDAAIRVWRSHIRVLTSDAGPFLAHSFDSAAELRRGDAWGRGNAWALLGIVDLLEVLPAQHPSWTDVQGAFRQLAQAVAEAQDVTGFWRTLLGDREAYLESSTAAMFGAAFTKAIRLGLLPAAFDAVADAAWRATVSRVDARGSFWGVSAWTHAAITRDDDPTAYKALPTETNWWGQGAALRAAAERAYAGLE